MAKNHGRHDSSIILSSMFKMLRIRIRHRDKCVTPPYRGEGWSREWNGLAQFHSLYRDDLLVDVYLLAACR